MGYVVGEVIESFIAVGRSPTNSEAASIQYITFFNLLGLFLVGYLLIALLSRPRSFLILSICKEPQKTKPFSNKIYYYKVLYKSSVKICIFK